MSKKKKILFVFSISIKTGFGIQRESKIQILKNVKYKAVDVLLETYFHFIKRAFIIPFLYSSVSGSGRISFQFPLMDPWWPRGGDSLFHIMSQFSKSMHLASSQEFDVRCDLEQGWGGMFSISYIQSILNHTLGQILHRKKVVVPDPSLHIS